MKSVNKVILLGHVTRDAELKKTPTGKSVCTFGLATNRTWKTPTGEKQSLAEYHSAVCWDSLAEFCSQYVKKGKPLYVEGYLKTHMRETDEGIKKERTEIVIDEIVMLGKDAKASTPDDGDEETE